MLKTSPLLATGGSPTSFHRRRHATPPSPVRPPSSSLLSNPASMTHPPHSHPSGALRHQPRVAPALSSPSKLRLQHGRPESKHQHQSRGAAPERELPAAVPPPSGHQQQSPQILSPNKRRVSLGWTGDAAASPAGSSQASPSATCAPKRARICQQPPKTLPPQYELCAVEDIVELIAHMLAELIATNDAIRISSGGLTRFHSRTAPGISVRDYLHRLARHATLTPPLLLAMVYYIDRLCAMYPEFTINTLTVHRFLITAATVAAKGLSDSFWNNSTYARVGGVRLAELKLLELEFLYRVDWKIVPNPEVLVAYYQGLVERTPQYLLESGDSPAASPSNSDDDANGQDEQKT